MIEMFKIKNEIYSNNLQFFILIVNILVGRCKLVFNYV